MIDLVIDHVNEDTQLYEERMIKLLSKTELDILRRIGRGFNYKEIASQLYVDVSTIRTHVGNIFGKIVVNDRTNAALFAVRNRNVVYAEKVKEAGK